MPIKVTKTTAVELRGVYSEDSLSLEFDPSDIGVVDEAVGDVFVTARAQDKRVTLEFRPDELDSLVRALLAAGFGRKESVEEDAGGCSECLERHCAC